MREAELRKLLQSACNFWDTTMAVELMVRKERGWSNAGVPECIDNFIELYYEQHANTCRKCGGDIDCTLSSLAESCGCAAYSKPFRLQDVPGFMEVPRELIECDLKGAELSAASGRVRWTGCNDPDEQGC